MSKQQRKRPASAKAVPGITRPTLAQLFQDSEEKDVRSTQLALEQSRTQLFLHAQARRRELEKAALLQVPTT